jgi:DNA-binding response OmpR family regulator
MPPKVLVIEDDEDIVELLVSRLTKMGYQVHAVPDAGIGLVEVERFAPQLILLDLMLPGGGGFAVLRALQQSAGPRVPVLVTTGLGDQEYRDKALELGADGFLQKPYDMALLETEIRRLVG